MEALRLIKPKLVPPLDKAFRPAALANRVFQEELGTQGVPLVIGLVREDETLTRFETRVHPDGHPRGGTDLQYVERLVKFLLWQRGGYKLYIGGPGASENISARATAPEERVSSMSVSSGRRYMTSLSR